MIDFTPLIRQRRAQMLVHSYLYYQMDLPIVDDTTWQRWADELAVLQFFDSNIGFYDTEFQDWDGSTGMHLPCDAWVRDKALYLLKLHEEFKNENTSL